MNAAQRNNPALRIESFGFCLPGEPIPLAGLNLDPDERQRLVALGQEFTFQAHEANSTALMVEAARAALKSAGAGPRDVGLVISAPSLITAYGLEIPAVEVRATLGLVGAQCVNNAQGCIGSLLGFELAAQRLAVRRNSGAVLVVTACVASTLTKNFNHGAFFWGDAAAAVVLTDTQGPGVHFVAYAESSSVRDWGAMRVPFGDSRPVEDCKAPEDFRLAIRFAGPRDQLEYVSAERERFRLVLDSLLNSQGIKEEDLSALLLPATGRNRMSSLLQASRNLEKCVLTDFRYPHMGAVDVLLFLHEYVKNRAPADGAWIAALSPAFTAQWGGVLLRYFA